MPAWNLFPDSVDFVHRSNSIWNPGLQGGSVLQPPESAVQVSGHVRGQPRWARGGQDQEGSIQTDLEHSPERCKYQRYCLDYTDFRNI